MHFNLNVYIVLTLSCVSLRELSENAVKQIVPDVILFNKISWFS